MTEGLRSEATVNPEEIPPRIIPVVERLQGFTHADIKERLDEEQADAKAGIAHFKLEGKLETPDGIYEFHAARVFSSIDEDGNEVVKKNEEPWVKPHWHTESLEPYVILKSTSGEMNTGRVVKGEVVWDPKSPKLVATNDVIIVDEDQVHSLRNTGEKPLDFVFACPESHLIDPPAEGADRFFTTELENALPPHYPKAA